MKKIMSITLKIPFGRNTGSIVTINEVPGINPIFVYWLIHEEEMKVNESDWDKLLEINDEIEEFCDGDCDTQDRDDMLELVYETLATKKTIVQPVLIILHTNVFGNIEHSDTHFVFNKETRVVYGKQIDDQ